VTHGRTLTIALILPLLLAAPVAAQTSAICERLFDQLVSAPEVIGTVPGARRYSQALTQQNMQIRQLRVEMRRMGCSSGSIVVFGGDHRAECSEMQSDLARMEDNKRAIADERDTARSAGNDGAYDRTSILAALDANGCTGDGLAPAEPQSAERDAGGVPDYRQVRGFDERTYDPAAGETPFYHGVTPPVTAARPSVTDVAPTISGGLRTMCVRTCDGAFFPISSNASPRDFPHQADLCAQRCPGAQTELYYHSTTDQESADMVSTVTGTPYKSLPTAFAYKDRPPGQKSECGCTMAAGTGGSIQTRGAAPQSTAAYSGITNLSGKSSAKPGVPAKPVTTEASVPNLAPPVAPTPIAPSTAVPSTSPAPATAVVASPPERPYDPDKNKVRVVGPEFLPAQQTTSIDLADPAVKGPQPLQQ